MCRLCGTKKEREKAKKEYRHMAQELNDLSHQYLLIAYGKIKPHTDEMSNVDLQAKDAIRFLVSEWL